MSSRNIDNLVLLSTQEYQRDAFGRLRVSNPLTMFDFNHIMGDLNSLFENQTANGGNITDSSASYLDLNVTDTSGSRVVRQSREYIPYQPGKSKLVYLTGILATDANESNVISRIGSFDSQNGIFFEFNNGTINLVKRTYGNDIRIARKNWTDPLDGTGNSRKNVNFEKAQIFTTDFEWLGVGQVRCGIVVDGIFRHCFTFKHSENNQLVKPYIKYANLPLRYEITSTGSANTCRIICGSVQSEGGYLPLGKSFIYQSLVLNSNLSTAEYRPIVSLSLREATANHDYNRGSLKIKGLEFMVPGGSYNSYRIIRNADISNNSGATFSNFNENDSIVRYRTYGSNDDIDPNSGILMNAGFMERNTSKSFISTIDQLFSSFPVVSDISGNPDIVTLAVKKVTGNSDLHYAINWTELY